MRKNTVKLRLSRETLNHLDLREARGGETPAEPSGVGSDATSFPATGSCIVTCTPTHAN